MFNTYAFLLYFTLASFTFLGLTASDSDSNTRSCEMLVINEVRWKKVDLYLNQCMTNVPILLSHFSSSRDCVLNRMVS